MEKLNVIQVSSNIKKVNEIKIDYERLLSQDFPFSSIFENSSIEKYFSSILKDFKHSLYKQLIEKCDSNLLLKYIEDANNVKIEINKNVQRFQKNPKYVGSSSLPNESKKNEYRFGNKILSKQDNTIRDILKFLDEVLIAVDYTSVEEYKKILFELEGNFEEEMVINENNRATFNLSKTDSLMFIYMLEKCNLLNFESDSHRNSFIEKNFNYYDLRKIQCDNKVQTMKGVGVDFANIKSNSKPSLKRFNKNLESLKDKLQIIMDFKLES
jgi:hypothetical protein